MSETKPPYRVMLDRHGIDKYEPLMSHHAARSYLSPERWRPYEPKLERWETEELLRELRALIDECIAGKPFDEMWDWLAGQVQNIADAGSITLHDLEMAAWWAVWHEDLFISEEEAREDLRRARWRDRR